jgi:hypothetical protein
MTQVMFGLRIIAYKIPKEGLDYFRKFFVYFFRAVRHGFTPYQALIYFTFYGHSHLTDGHRFPTTESPPLFWRLTRGVLARFMRTLKQMPRETSRILQLPVLGRRTLQIDSGRD